MSLAICFGESISLSALFFIPLSPHISSRYIPICPIRKKTGSISLRAAQACEFSVIFRVISLPFSLFLSFSSPYYPISLPQCLALGHFLARHPACAQVSVPLSSSLICSSIPRLKSQKIPPLRFFKVHRFFANVIYANCGSVKIPQNSVFICYFYHFVQYYFFKAGMYKNQISDLRLRLTQCSSKFVYAFIFWKLSRKVR